MTSLLLSQQIWEVRDYCLARFCQFNIGWKSGVSACLCKKNGFDDKSLKYLDSTLSRDMKRCCPKDFTAKVTNCKQASGERFLQCSSKGQGQTSDCKDDEQNLVCASNQLGTNNFTDETLYLSNIHESSGKYHVVSISTHSHVTFLSLQIISPFALPIKN